MKTSPPATTDVSDQCNCADRTSNNFILWRLQGSNEFRGEAEEGADGALVETPFLIILVLRSKSCCLARSCSARITQGGQLVTCGSVGSGDVVPDDLGKFGGEFADQKAHTPAQARR